MNLARFKKLPVMGILRGIESDVITPLIETIIASGLETIEITMNTKDAAKLIKKTVKISNKQLMVGAGTVISKESLMMALDAGATFIVMPVFLKDIAGYCTRHKIPVFPGALTPKEVYDAWMGGAAMVKVFPSGFFGPGYFRELKGPFENIELMACGGVTPENIRSYFTNGATAVAFGAGVFRKEWLSKKAFDKMQRRIKEYLRFF
jgi:2-dehydro-3-deoxyphosphogluconate aldolase / (4S)-4-hydroxy-2-oxoglutarate aldolase